MRRTVLLSALLAVACSGSSKSTTTEPLLPPEPAPTPPVVADPVPAPKPAPPPEVDAKPDTPSGAAAARDAELGAKVAGYIDAFTNSEPHFTKDGKRILFVSNRDGLPQLYVADAKKPTAAAKRLVTTTERVGSPVPTHDGKAMIYRSDTGADENWSMFRVGLDGAGTVELTTGEKLQRESPVLVDGAPGVMFFSGRKLSEAKSTIYSASTLQPGPAKAIHTDDKPTSLYDVRRDGKVALAGQYPSRDENFLLRVDLATGKATTIFPASGKVSIFAAAFAADGKRVYVATDAGAEQQLVLALDATTGKELARHAISPPTAQVSGMAVARRGNTIAIGIIVGDHAEIRLLDAVKLTPRAKVAMPLGTGYIGEFSDDGKRLPAVWSVPTTPNDIFAIDVKTGKAAPLRKEPRPSLAGVPPIEASVTEVPAFDGGKIPVIVYMPSGESTKKHPVIVSYHGGPAGVSQIRWSAANAFFLSLGYVVVEPNVRGSSGYGRAYEAGDNGMKRPDALKDVETSARWVAAQPWADKDRLVVYGGSYGGYTTLIALARWPDIWRAGVNLFGVANLKTFMATTSGLIRKIFIVEMGDPDKDAAFLESISPLAAVDKIVDPTFVYAGANDPRVPRSESDLIVKALRQRRIPSEYMVADNEGHSLARRETQIAFYSRAARFLETHLK